jgi:undecaprenyl-diphosphatase
VLKEYVDTLDSKVDEAFEPWRGRPTPDLLAAIASNLGDRGLVWLLFGMSRAKSPEAKRRNVQSVVYTGIVTPAVNSLLKDRFGRERPERDDDSAPPVRIPQSSSFPSGHALAAACAAVLLSKDSNRTPIYVATAAAVCASRVHLRFHHASDVLAGVAIGSALGAVGRKIIY